MPSGALGKRRQDLSWRGGSAELREKNLELGTGTIKAGGVEAKMDRDGQARQVLTIHVQDPTPTYPKPKDGHRRGSTWGASWSPHMASY